MTSLYMCTQYYSLSVFVVHDSSKSQLVCIVVVDGNWTDWTQWTACSKSCGFGTKMRTRSCTNPAPLDCGKDCEPRGYNNKEVLTCNKFNCSGMLFHYALGLIFAVSTPKMSKSLLLLVLLSNRNIRRHMVLAPFKVLCLV